MSEWFLRGSLFALGFALVLVVIGTSVVMLMKRMQRHRLVQPISPVGKDEHPTSIVEPPDGLANTGLTGQDEVEKVYHAAASMPVPLSGDPETVLEATDQGLSDEAKAKAESEVPQPGAEPTPTASSGLDMETGIGGLLSMAITLARRQRRQLVSIEVLASMLIEHEDTTETLLALGVDRSGLQKAMTALIRAQPVFEDDATDIEPLPMEDFAQVLMEALRNCEGPCPTTRALLATILERQDGDAAKLLASYGVTLNALQRHGPLPESLSCVRAADLQHALPLPRATAKLVARLSGLLAQLEESREAIQGPQVLALGDGPHAEEHQAVLSIARALPTHRPLLLVARTIADQGKETRQALLEFLREVKQPTLLWISEVGPLFTEPDNALQAHAREGLASLLDALSPGPAALTLVFTFDPLYPHAQRMRRSAQGWLELPWSAPEADDRRALIEMRSKGEPATDTDGEDWRAALADLSEGMTLGDLDALLKRGRLMARLADRSWPDLQSLRTEASALRRQRIGNGMLAGSGQRHTASTARVQVSGNAAVGLDTLAGLDGVKAELERYRALVMDRVRFVEAGCRVPRGLLLQGPPGVGKTAIARAFAATLGRPFFSLAGSEFVELYVGVGPARVRDLFRSARAHQPCVIFIDELDAIGGRRDEGQNRETTATLNQLLVELDGFDVSDGVFVMAATNRINLLDEALIRAGRFDNCIHIPLPDPATREAILRKLLGRRHSIDDADVHQLVAETEHWAGAEIENIVNRARIDAVRAGGDGNIDAALLMAAQHEVAASRRSREGDTNYDDDF